MAKRVTETNGACHVTTWCPHCGGMMGAVLKLTTEGYSAVCVGCGAALVVNATFIAADLVVQTL